MLNPNEKTWRNVKCILLSERSQSEKATYRMIPTLWLSGKGETMETMKRSGVARGMMNRQSMGKSLGQWNTPHGYNDGEVSLFPKPVNVQHQSELWGKLWTLGDYDVSM